MLTSNGLLYEGNRNSRMQLKYLRFERKTKIAIATDMTFDILTIVFQSHKNHTQCTLTLLETL